jgi:hypothetical protein
MGIDKTEELLKRFDYRFERKNNELIIKMDFSQIMIIDFSDSEKIKIKDKLVEWNFLTGLIEMSIKNATLYNFIAAMVITFLFVFLDYKSDKINLMFFFLAVIIWLLLWKIFYLVKAENLKRILISWNE